MNLDKAHKRIDKRVKRGFQGYPIITIAYSGPHPDLATQVEVGFVEQENATPLLERFISENDIRHDETVQTTIVKIIDRADAKTVKLEEKVYPLK